MFMKTRLAYWSPRLGYAFGSAFRGFSYTSLSVFFLFYLTGPVGLSPALAGGVLAAPKVWDAFVDPLLGAWVDRQALRAGRRWPFLLAAGLMALLTYVGLFSLPKLATPSATAAITLLLLILNSMSETVFAVCHLSISGEITKNPKDLTGLFSLATTIFTIMTIVGSTLPPYIIGPLAATGRSGYAHMALVGAGMSLVLLLSFILLTLKTPVTPASKEVTSLSLFASFRAATTNRSFVFLLIYFVMASAASSILNAFTPYANLYVLHGGKSGLAIFGGVMAAAGMAGYPLAPQLVRRVGVQRSLRLGNLAVALTYALLFGVSFAALWANWAAIAVMGILSGLLSVLILAALVDVSRAPVRGALVVPIGFYYGMIICGLKLGGSAGGVVAGMWLAASGFVAGSAHQSSAVIIGIRAGYTLLLFAMFAASAPLLNRIRIVAESGADTSAATALLSEAH